MKFRWGIASLVLVFVFASSAFGQWKMLKDFGAQIYTVHFLDREGYPQIGFVGLTTGEVWRTSDGGATWIKTTTPASLIGQVRDFTFKDSLTGWLAASQSQLSPGCYMTTDAGMSWIPLSPTGQRMAIYYNPKTQALILNGWNGATSIYSVDGGASWTSTGAFSANTCGIAFTDSLHGLMTVFGANVGGYYFYTTDGGIIWNALTQTAEAFQPLAIKGTHTYFVCAEGFRQILRTNDDGKSWSLIHQFPLSLDLSGDIRGDLSALYIQGKTGTFYSVDQGVTWTDYCGPHNDFDTRMYNLGPDSLYAGTLEGELWLNPFGVRRNKDLLQFSASPFDLVSDRCTSIDSFYKFINLSNCLVVKILNISLIPGPGANTFKLKLPIFPVTIADSATDSMKITYTPDNSSTDSAQIDIKYSVGGETFEVKRWIRGIVKPGFNVLLSKDLKLLLSSDCSKLDTFITIKSGLCSDDTLLAVQLSDPTAFTITPPALPAPIAAGKSLLIPISVKSLGAGSYNAFITLTIRSGGITRDTTINLGAIILAASQLRMNITPDSAVFGTVSICDQVIDTVILKNTICKNLFIKNISIQPASAATEYSFVQLNHTIPDSLSPKASDTILVQYKPTIGGLAAGYLRFTIGFDLVNTHDTNISVYGIGKALAGSALESSLLAFDPTVPCTPQQLSTHLYNNSCGTDTIVAIIPAKDQSFSAINPTPPLAIASGDSTTITIQEDSRSAGAKFDSVGVIIHSSTGAIDTVMVRLSGIVNQAIHKLSFVPLALDSISPCTQLDTTIELRNLGICDTLTVDSASLSGPGWFVLSTGTLPVKILPGGSFFVTIRFTPGSGANGNGTIHLKGNGIDTTIAIHASSRAGGALYALTTSGTLFSSSLCKPALHIFTFQNTSCDTIILDDVSLNNTFPGGTQFSFTPKISLPDTILPGKKFDLTVTFDPLGTGDSTANITYHSTVNGFGFTKDLTGTLATSKQTAKFELVVGTSGKTISAYAGSSVTVRLLLQSAVGDTIGLTSTKATLAYSDDVLGVITGPVASPGWALNSSTPGKGALTLDLSRTNTNSLPAGTEIATVQFEPYVAVSTYTLMNIQNIQFNNDDPAFASCVLGSQALAPLLIDITPECGNTVLRGFLGNDNAVFGKISIRPNPVTSGSQITVSLELGQKSDVNIILSNALGQQVSSVRRSSLAKGIQSIYLDLPSGAGGLYILTLEAGGKRESRKIVIEK